MLATLSAGLTIGHSQDRSKEGRLPDPNDPLVNFSIRNPKDFDLARRSREKAIRESIGILERRLRTAPGESEKDYAGSAILMLGDLRAGESNAVYVLCNHLTYPAGVVMISDNEWDPLLLYPAAQALVKIGGREAAEGILRRMKQKLDRKELLICAHVLNQIDDEEVTLERMRVAVTKRLRGEDPLAEDRKVFFDDLSKVKQWLEDPTFETDKQFRP